MSQQLGHLLQTEAGNKQACLHVDTQGEKRFLDQIVLGSHQIQHVTDSEEPW